MPGVTTRALVLGGGGLAGIAWEVGVLVGLADAGVDVAAADRIVGTSAGSIVGTLVASGTDLAAVHARHLAADPGGGTGGAAPTVDMEALGAAFGAAMATSDDPVAMRRRLGSFALSVTTPEQERRELIAARLPAAATTGAWPDRDLRVTAVDTASGEIAIFTRESRVVLAEAVAASCAVPGVWPPITVGGRRYMDGGMASIVHVAEADRPAPAARLLVVAPLDPPAGGPFPSVAAEVDRQRAEHPDRPTAAVLADADSLRAFGANVLDPATMPGAAVAGREQGRRAAAEVAEVWGRDS